MTSDILNLLNQTADHYGVSRDLAVAVARQESGGNPHAVSAAGAQGVMQLMPATAAALGVSNPFDPAQNIDAGVRYLAQMLSQFSGEVELALAAYNWGPGRVAQNGYDNWPAETVNYVRSILNRIGQAFTTPDQAPPVPAPQIITDPMSGEVVGYATTPPAEGTFGPAAAIGLLTALGLLTWVINR